MESVIRSKNVLINGTFQSADVAIKGGKIARVHAYKEYSVAVDFGELKIVPGFVDLHSDAIEKEVEPRHGATFPIELAISELDKKLAMSGITTMFHAIGFEENPKKNRSIEAAYEQIKEIHGANKHFLSVDNLIHVRFELSNAEAAGVIKELIDENMVDLLSFMDHSPGQGQFHTLELFRTYYAKNHGLNESELEAIIQKKQNKDEKVIQELLKYAKKHSITLLSHDDDSVDKLDTLLGMGIKISEFPLSLEVARYATKHGIKTGMGAPNIVRGGSQSGNIAAIELVREGVCSYLCSDYHPTSMLQSVYRMQKDGEISLEEGFEMITKTPSLCAKLDDRGEIKEGLNADIVVIDDSHIPKVVLCIKDGESIYSSLRRVRL